MDKKHKPTTVEAYMAAAPREVRDRLKELRAIIRSTAPTAGERLSYGMPFYDYKGRLVYFAAAKTHIGLYIPPPIIQEHQRELQVYVTTKSAVHFPIEKKLPVVLIKKLVRARMRFNEGRK